MSKGNSCLRTLAGLASSASPTAIWIKEVGQWADKGGLINDTLGDALGILEEFQKAI